MTEPVNLSEYARKRDLTTSTTLGVTAGQTARYEYYEYRSAGDWGVGDVETGARLNAAALYKPNPDSELASYLRVAERAIAEIQSTQAFVRSGSLLSADDSFMGLKRTLAELLMFRTVSDSVGLVAMRCYQAALQVKVISDAGELPDTLARALHRVWGAPYLDFDEACSLADEIEAVATQIKVAPGYVEVCEELIADSEAEPVVD